MLDLKLYIAQRISAMIMGPLVLGHLAVMIYAIQGIVSRTQGSIFWFVLDGTFVIAVSVHAAIGMRVIMHEWLGLKGAALPLLTWSLCLILLFMGARAVMAVTLL